MKRPGPCVFERRAALTLCTIALSVLPLAHARGQGVVVVTVDSKGVAYQQGIRPGDVLREWRSGSGRGALRSDLDLNVVDVEQRPRGVVVLIGQRGSLAREWTLGPRAWALSVRPEMSAGTVAALVESAALAGKGHAAAAAARAKAAAIDASRPEPTVATPYLFARAARHFADVEAWGEASAAFARAVDAVRGLGLPRGQLERLWGDELAARNRWQEAEDHYREAVAAEEPGSLAAAAAMEALGVMTATRGDARGAIGLFEQALSTREALAPESLAVAESLNDLGLASRTAGLLDSAEAVHRRALGIRQRLAPESAELATSHLNLGLVRQDRGYLGEAQQQYAEAQRLFLAVAPDSLELAATFNNIGLLAMNRGDFVESESALKEALAIRAKLRPGSLEHAGSVNNLAAMYYLRGDGELSEPLLRQALVIKERLAPESTTVANTLDTLSIVLRNGGQLDEAERLARRSLTIKQRTSPRAATVASSLMSLGNIAFERRQFAEATDWFHRAVDLLESASPAGLGLATAYRNVGKVALRVGDFEEAERAYLRAVELTRAAAPSSADYSESLRGLGRARWDLGDRTAGAELFERAMTVLEVQTGQLGASLEGRVNFGAESYDTYRDYLARLVEDGQPAKAFQVLERSRARVLREVIGQHFHSPADSSPSDGARTGTRAVEGLDVSGVASGLDVGTTLVSYSVGETETLIFVVVAGDARVSVLRRPHGAAQLAEKIGAFRSEIQRHDRPLREVRTLGRQLYDWLFEGVEGLEGADRLLIVPDGVLHVLPFAALVHPSGKFLIEWKPFYLTLSATAQRDLRAYRSRQATHALDIIAFADPRRVAGAVSPAGRSGARRPPLPPLALLPASRSESAQLAALFGDRARTYVGAQATESRAVAAGSQARYVHFAVHSLLNQQRPLESALVLAQGPPADRQDGILEAGELVERARWSADLVVLSGCETGMGKDFRGEGVLGLTAALHHVGVPAVVASLWRTDDRKNSRLMPEFYRQLRGGATPDAALRAAQRHLIARTASAHPYYWAGFFLSGDSR
jgi:CHAT domain-containing protein/tetratricopeptide (TPR) repeat protein